MGFSSPIYQTQHSLFTITHNILVHPNAYILIPGAMQTRHINTSTTGRSLPKTSFR